MKITALILALFSLLSGYSVNPPPLDTECTSEYFHIFEIQESLHCNLFNPPGDYHLFACTIKESNEILGEYTTIKFTSKCVYPAGIEIPEVETHVIMLPIITNNDFITSSIKP